MSAGAITQRIIQSLKTDPCDFYLINYANADMVGHSGNFGTTIKAIEYLDTQIALLYNQIVEKMNGTMYITADHGNAEDMYDEDAHQPRTAHTINPDFGIGLDTTIAFDLPGAQNDIQIVAIVHRLVVDIPLIDIPRAAHALCAAGSHTMDRKRYETGHSPQYGV